ncbi:hypothetical protein PHLGIDRAFT_222482 [Phlebiopsis gigantea 11061_1 CR5-6]|uniref:G-protein coupled receptors family 1 profile domain-containing protein n=1 Tax=Phlebiopsis gigantea (strain 11061_1 CR5-6) TaxID=745531 RepID=A0A0C3S627_PHLG1|nr:hypothetical protein PHLGIDRAFT_222482 [Phlebiopsis gigantea 11061_1 CR5-6]
MSTGFSDSDIATLERIGHDSIVNIVALCIDAIFYTLYFILVIIAGHMLLKRGPFKAALFTLTLMVLMLLMDTAICIIDVSNAIHEITLTITSNSDISLADRYTLTDNFPWAVEDALYAWMSNLGDVIIISRVYAFYQGEKERWFMLLPISLLFGSLITSVLISFCTAQWSENASIGHLIDTDFCENVQLSSYCTTVATTAAATAMMSYKLWQYSREIAHDLRSVTSGRTRLQRIMMIFIQSGVLYLLFFIEAIITDSSSAIIQAEVATTAKAFACTIWTYMTSHIVGIYPAVVVILAHSQRSCFETVS